MTPERLLLGPGPSNASARVRAALAEPLLGHLDPAFLAILDRVQARLREVFRTQNPLTLPISGTGSAGMEACLVNLLEPGDDAVIGVNGAFGERMCAMVERIGARPIRVEAPWGEPIPAERVIAALDQHRPRLVAWVHAETSTGVAQPVAEIAAGARQRGVLTVLDCVTSLGGMDVRIDEWGIDAAYAGTQKCLSCPPGLAPLTVGPRALERLASRKQPVQSWYLDLSLIGRYFGTDRVYHHTAPISMIYALDAALGEVLDEGLEARFARHVAAHRALVAGLEVLGYRFAVAAEHRLPMLNAVIPPVLDEKLARKALLDRHGIEVGGGLGPLAGRIWRIGLMGSNATCDTVERLLEGLHGLT